MTSTAGATTCAALLSLTLTLGIVSVARAEASAALPAETAAAAPASAPSTPTSSSAPASVPAAPESPLPPRPPDALPGSPIPPGLGLSPEAPRAQPPPGGRAPSFGAPTQERATSFRIGGRIYGWEAVGIGRSPGNPPAGYHGSVLHAPMLSNGKIPFWGGAGATLNFQYGTRHVTAFASYYFRVKGNEYQGYTNPGLGPGFGMAYLLITPDPLGKVRLNFRVGGIIDVYAGPGQWGWGIFGPMLALRGWGETTNGEWEVTRDLRLTFNHGVLAVPGVPEDFARGDYNGWIETGVSNFVHHAHLGAVLSNRYTLKLHYASAYGIDERTYLKTFLKTPPADGRMDAYLGEVRWQADPWGQLGVSGGVYNFDKAASVGDGIWWTTEWTQGAREMINKFLGSESDGTGKIAVVSAEYDFSVAPILWRPRSFTGQAPDLRVAIAAMLTRTIDTRDARYQGANGYYFGLDTEYRMTSLFSMTFQTYGEHHDTAAGPLDVYSLNPGIAFHTDWISTDRIQLIYGRRFYSSAADPNTARPLDRHMIALGGYITF